MSPEGWGRTTYGMVFAVFMTVLFLLKVNNIVSNIAVIVFFLVVSIVVAIVAGAVVSARIRDYQDSLAKK